MLSLRYLILSLFCLPSLTCVSPYVVYSIDLRHKDACATEWFAALAGPVSTFVTVLLPLSETQYRCYQEISWIEGWVVQARRIDIWYQQKLCHKIWLWEPRGFWNQDNFITVCCPVTWVAVKYSWFFHRPSDLKFETLDLNHPLTK